MSGTRGGMNDGEMDALLNSVEGIEEPSAETKARGKAQLLAALGAAAASSAGGASAASGGSGTLSTAGGSGSSAASAAALKPLVLALLIGGAAFGVAWMNGADAETVAEVEALPREVPVGNLAEPEASSEPPALVPSVEPEEESEAEAQNAGTASSAPQPEAIPRRSPVPPAARADSRETPAPTDVHGGALLRRAIDLQNRGEHAAALRVANAHRERFPDSRLRVEREAIAVGALCQLGRSQEAQAREEAIQSRQEAAYLTRRIQQYCD